MIENTKPFAVAAAAFAVVGAFQFAFSDSAEAKRGRGGSSPSVEFSETTPYMPNRGYEGFAGIGLGAYCSYRREPWRKCYINRYGEEECRTAGWRRIHHCY